MHIWKNAQMTRTNKRLKQGNTRKIITILQLYQRESYPNICRLYINNTLVYIYIYTGADPGFQARGAYFKKLRRVEGGAKIFGVFRVKNHYFTQKKNHIFSNFRGERAACAPWIRPWFRSCRLQNHPPPGLQWTI